MTLSVWLVVFCMRSNKFVCAAVIIGLRTHRIEWCVRPYQPMVHTNTRLRRDIYIICIQNALHKRKLISLKLNLVEGETEFAVFVCTQCECKLIFINY